MVKNPPGSAEEKIRVPSLGQEDTLEEETANQSNILAWRILGTEESGRLQSPLGCKELGTN